MVSPITVFPDLVKNEIDNRRVKTNCTIPAWLKELAEQSGINYSQLLECALLDYSDNSANEFEFEFESLVIYS